MTESITPQVIPVIPETKEEECNYPKEISHACFRCKSAFSKTMTPEQWKELSMKEFVVEGVMTKNLKFDQAAFDACKVNFTRTFVPTEWKAAKNKTTKMAQGKCPVCDAGMSKIVSNQVWGQNAPVPVVNCDCQSSEVPAEFDCEMEE